MLQSSFPEEHWMTHVLLIHSPPWKNGEYEALVGSDLSKWRNAGALGIQSALTNTVKLLVGNIKMLLGNSEWLDV